MPNKAKDNIFIDNQHVIVLPFLVDGGRMDGEVGNGRLNHFNKWLNCIHNVQVCHHFTKTQQSVIALPSNLKIRYDALRVCLFLTLDFGKRANLGMRFLRSSAS